jgi:hypothetical protein
MHPVVVGLLTALVLPSGCAATFRGTTQKVHFRSVPPGASLEVDGRVFTTPAIVKLKRGRSHLYQISRSDCGVSEGLLLSRACGAATPSFWCGLDIAGAVMFIGLPALAIDVYTGALSELEPNQVTVALPRCGIEPARAP